jgi:hypothetical protein
MAYAITFGIDASAPTQRCETATAAIELVKKLQAEKRPNVKIHDRIGAAITVADLEKLSAKENI